MSEGDGDELDPEWIFDDEWVANASVREPSARIRVAQAEFARQDAERAERHRRERRRRTRKRRALRLGSVAAVLLCVGLINLVDRGGAPQTSWSSPSDGVTAGTALGDRPTPRAAESSEPLGRPADPDASGGRYAFVQAQPGDDDAPVTYDPCRPIAIVVNERAAPKGARDIVERAVAEVSEVTGLTIAVEDTTDEEPREDRSAFQPGEYGDRWAPVLIAWSDPEEVPLLADDVAGLGGSAALQVDDRRAVFVTGQITLDGPQIAEIMQRPGGELTAEDVVLHELGHLLGLDHVDDPTELMYPEGQVDVHGLQRGDRTGLTRLGQGSCVGQL